jgi:Periplasmic binding protein/AAA domain
MALHRFGRMALLSAMASLGLSGAPAIAQEVIKIGAPLALTGGLTYSGNKQKLGFDLWLERINKAGGISVGGRKHQIELVIYDYQTDGKRAGELAEKLINDHKVSFMIAPYGSAHTEVTAAVAERYGVPIVAVASSEAVHDQGFKHLFGMLAPRGVGKTLLALSIGLAVASGSSLLCWSAPRPRRVLYVDGEMTLVDLQQRMLELSVGFGHQIPNDAFRMLAADHTEHGIKLATQEGQEGNSPASSVLSHRPRPWGNSAGTDPAALVTSLRIVQQVYLSTSREQSVSIGAVSGRSRFWEAVNSR